MAHLFISYSRGDQTLIEKLAKALEAAGHSVWWDRHIRGGAVYAKDIEAQLRKADAVIVAWSASATESDWVKDEAVFARDKGILIPIDLSGCDAPLGFRQYQTIDFHKWKGGADEAAFHALQNAIAEIAGGERVDDGDGAPLSLIEKIKSKPRFAIGAGVAFAAMVALAAIGAMRLGAPASDIPAAKAQASEPHEVSIAILPFLDMSPEGNQGYFADGLSEELLNVLTRIDGLKVASRTSSFALKNEMLSVAEIAERLNVNHVLEGSVRKTGNRVRITAQLIDAYQDRHLWSQTYDRHMSDIFRVQDEIATAVLGALRGELGIEEGAPIEIKRDTDNLSAYDAYLKARELFIARGAANVRESLRLFEEVVDMDPDFARGWEGLAAVYAVATSWGILDRDYSALSLVAAKRALELDPDLSMPYAVMGLTYRTHYPTPWEESISNLKMAIERDAKNVNAWLWLGMNYMAVGRPDVAIEAFNTCLELDEAQRLCRKYRSISHLFKGDADAAMPDAERNAEIGYFGDFDVYLPIFLNRGDRVAAFAVSRNIYWRSGFPHKDLMAALENPEDQPPDRLDKFKAWAEPHKVDIADRTFVMLALRAYDEINVETFDNDYEDLWLPAFSHFRQSPQFKQLAADLGLVDYWRATGFPAACRAISDAEFECE